MSLKRYLRQNFPSNFEQGLSDAKNGRPRALLITPTSMFTVSVADYANGYNAGLHEVARRKPAASSQGDGGSSHG